MKFFKSTFFAGLLLSVAWAPCTPAAGTATPAASAPEQLVKQLGDDDVTRREAAEKALATLGAPARKAVKEALESKDPEVRVRAARAWETLRWCVIPGLSSHDIADLKGSPYSDSEVKRNWNTQLAANGGGMAPLLLAMWADKGSKQNACQVLWLMLERLETDAIAKGLSDAVASGDFTAENVRSLLAAAPSSCTLGRKTQARLCELQLRLWLYEDAVNTAFQYWMRWRDDAYVDVCRRAIVAGGIQKRIWTGFDRFQKDVANGMYWRGSLLFYLKLAGALGTPECVREGVVKFDSTKLSEPDNIARALIDIGLAKEALALFEKSESPTGLYARSMAQAALGNDVKAKEARDAAFKAVAESAKGEKAEAVYSMFAYILRRQNDPDAALIWKKVLEIEPADSYCDATAWVGLARIAEAKGDFAGAADCYEKVLVLVQKGGFYFALSNEGDLDDCAGDEAIEWLRRHIAELRAR